VERVSRQDGRCDTGEQTGDAGGRIRRSTGHVAKGGAVGTGDEMRSDWGGVRPSQKNQTCGQKARSTPMISAKPERHRKCQHLRSPDRNPPLRDGAPIRLSLAVQEVLSLGRPGLSATEPGAGVDWDGLNACCCLLLTRRVGVARSRTKEHKKGRPEGRPRLSDGKFRRGQPPLRRRWLLVSRRVSACGLSWPWAHPALSASPAPWGLATWSGTGRSALRRV